VNGLFPKPLIDDESRPFWDGLKREELMIQHCLTCDKFIFYPRLYCPHCFSDNVSWTKSSGWGHIYSYTVVHNAAPPFKNQTPFVVAIVELEEGVRMMSRIIGEQGQVQIDKTVSVIFEQIDDELTLPYFKLL
jgi:uncharacterized protein